MAATDRQKFTQARCTALYPGAFRPPHKAHMATVQKLIEQPDIDEVVIIISSRFRLIPGTTLALESSLAKEIWGIYLLGESSNVRIEIAPTTAIRHAMSYFSKTSPGDTLLFCMGEADFKQGDTRFKDIQRLAEQTGINARQFTASTLAISVRSTDVRRSIMPTSRKFDEFMHALPAHLSNMQRLQVLCLCRTRARSLCEITTDRITYLLDELGYGAVTEIRIGRNKLDPVFFVKTAMCQKLVVKYAGDNLVANCVRAKNGQKPRDRLKAEWIALNWLGKQLHYEIRFPRPIHYDNQNKLLLLSDVSRDACILEDKLKQGVFVVDVVKTLGHYLGRCIAIGALKKSLWEDKKTEIKRWHRILSYRLLACEVGESTPTMCQQLKQLREDSQRAAGAFFLHMDFQPKNISLADGKIAVVDFEASNGYGDPAADLGSMIGHYLFHGIQSGKIQLAQISCLLMIKCCLIATGDRENTGLVDRTWRFAGVCLLSMSGDKRASADCCKQISKLGVALLSGRYPEVLQNVDHALNTAWRTQQQFPRQLTNA